MAMVMACSRPRTRGANAGRPKPKWEENPPPLKACRFDSDLGHHPSSLGTSILRLLGGIVLGFASSPHRLLHHGHPLACKSLAKRTFRLFEEIRSDRSENERRYLPSF